MSKKIVGLTGGIGSGKSLAADYFAKLGITIIDTDKIAREIVKPNTTLFKKIVKKFGRTIITPEGSLDRVKLRSKIFSDYSARKWLEKLLHPVIIDKMIKQAKKATSPYCLLILPLLFEAQLENKVNDILVIDAPKKLRIKRIQERDHLKIKDIQAMMETQVTRKERLAKANHVIKNNSVPSALKKQIEKLHKFYLTSRW